MDWREMKWEELRMFSGVWVRATGHITGATLSSSNKVYVIQEAFFQ